MKKTIITIATLLTIGSNIIAQESTLGLAERRAIKEYQEKTFPDIKKNLMAAIGFDVTLDIKWEQIARAGEANAYSEDSYWGTTIFKPLTAAIKTITADAEGKTALKAKLKKIVIMLDEKTAPASNYTNGLDFKDGVLTVNFRPYSNADESDMKERIEAIKKFLEDKL